ncbi:hypothetical protein AB6A23_19275 [Paenibacillus tarimensis]
MNIEMQEGVIGMEQYELAELVISRQEETFHLRFASAQLVIVTDLGSKLWYVDVSGISQTGMLQALNVSEDIKVDLEAVTAGGRRYRGTGYMHPNVIHQAAAIRGDGELVID